MLCSFDSSHGILFDHEQVYFFLSIFKRGYEANLTKSINTFFLFFLSKKDNSNENTRHLH